MEIRIKSNKYKIYIVTLKVYITLIIHLLYMLLFTCAAVVMFQLDAYVVVNQPIVLTWQCQGMGGGQQCVLGNKQKRTIHEGTYRMVMSQLPSNVSNT